MEEILKASAIELAKGIREKKYSSQEVLSAFLQNIAQHNPRLHAIITLDEQRAKKQAIQADQALAEGKIIGALHGVPMTVKDSYATEGIRTTYGIPFTRNHVPTQDATAVARLRKAGAIVFGKTNIPLACYDWQCKQPGFPRANNPWDINRTPGGSSGGSAAALAAHFTPLELGSDIAGSLRVPAHFCGVYTIRPTDNMVSRAGHMSIPGFLHTVRHFVSCGPMARNIDDLRLALKIISGPDSRQWEIPPSPQVSQSSSLLRDLKIAWVGQFDSTPVCPDTTATMEQVVSSLERQGAFVKETSPKGFTMSQAFETWCLIHGFEFAATFPFPLRSAPFRWPWRSGIIKAVFGGGEFTHHLGRGLSSTPHSYFKALVNQDNLVAKWENFFCDWDIWITPVGAIPAFTHRRTGKEFSINGKKTPYTAAMGVYSCPTAVFGHPIVVIPAGISQEGLPIGIQIHGKRWDDYRLLDIAQNIAQALPSPRTAPLT